MEKYNCGMIDFKSHLQDSAGAAVNSS